MATTRRTCPWNPAKSVPSREPKLRSIAPVIVVQMASYYDSADRRR